MMAMLVLPVIVVLLLNRRVVVLVRARRILRLCHVRVGLRILLHGLCVLVLRLRRFEADAEAQLRAQVDAVIALLRLRISVLLLGVGVLRLHILLLLLRMPGLAHERMPALAAAAVGASNGIQSHDAVSGQCCDEPPCCSSTMLSCIWLNAAGVAMMRWVQPRGLRTIVLFVGWSATHVAFHSASSALHQPSLLAQVQQSAAIAIRDGVRAAPLGMRAS